MADYNEGSIGIGGNLTSLEGFNPGDRITILANDNLIRNIDTKGYKIKIELHAGAFRSTGYTAGGLTIASIDTSKIPKITLCSYRRSLHVAYGTFSDYDSCLYYRFLVAGACSHLSQGAGGGSSGGNILGVSSSTILVRGGSQTKGGSGASASNDGLVKAGASGTFGYGGGDKKDGSYSLYEGGAGWYGGGEGNSKSNYSKYGGGGSGFIIGQTTTTYPSGFMGDDQELIQTLTEAVYDASTIQGGSEYNGNEGSEYRIIITILEKGTSGPSIMYYTNGKFEEVNMYYYTDGEFVQVVPSIYSNNEFLPKLE